MDKSLQKVAYIHARPHGHPIHEAYAQSLDPDRYFIDFALRWHDRQRPAIVRYLSWILCALLFPKRRNYDVFYADGPVHFLALMKYFGLIRKGQSIIFLMDDETLHFLHHGYYGPIASHTLKWILSKADGFICVGYQQEVLLKEVCKTKSLIFRTIVNGIADNRYEELNILRPELSSNQIICIANVGDSDTRLKYKGLDYIPQILNQLRNKHLEVLVIGEVSIRIQQLLNAQIAPSSLPIKFVGKILDLSTCLKTAFLSIHPARGESWGISILECMRAGVPVIVSTDTGAKQLVKTLGPSWVLPQECFARQVDEFYESTFEDKVKISDRARALTQGFNFSECTRTFNRSFWELTQELRSQLT
ncbi:MAG TPA: glycosyltransferase [Cytophagales bacterium]|nr:glycosyltransferase [Cytophagales bacterium]